MLQLAMDQPAYTPGQPVKITLSLCNESDRTREYPFSSAQRFDLRIDNAAGETVWTWSQGRFFAQVMTTLLIAPGDCRVFSAEWLQTNAEGASVPSGCYTVHAWIVGTAEQERATGTLQVLPAEVAGYEEQAKK